MKKFMFLLFASTLVLFSCSKDQDFNQTNEGPGTEEARQAPFYLHCYEPTTKIVRVCPDVIDPVCACDVITFSNSCEADAMGFKNYVPGACYDKQNLNCRLETVAGQFRQSGVQCAAVYQPVCGCDGKTYGNYCYAVTNGVTAWTPGACGSIATSTPNIP